MPAWVQAIVSMTSGAAWITNQSLDKPAFITALLRYAEGKSWQSELQVAFGLVIN